MADRAGGRGTQTALQVSPGTGSTGFASRLTQYASLNYWFGPGMPPLPNAPTGTLPRSNDYGYGYNIQRNPRYEEGKVSFAQLRQLADASDIVRIVIETRKDEMDKQEGNFRLRVIPGESKAKAQARNSGDARLAYLNQFMLYPDKEHSFKQWMRMLMEETLVLDAPAIWIRPTVSGELHSLRIIRGDTIVRKIDETGGTPTPPNVAYQQVIHGGMISDEFTSDQLIYMPRNPAVHRFYGYSPVEQIITTILIALRRMNFQMKYYTHGNMPMGLFRVPDTWSPMQIKQAQEWLDAMLMGSDEGRQKGIFIPNFDPVFPQKEVLKDEFDEWLARIVCKAFSTAPTPFIKQTNRSVADNATAESASQGLAPLMDWFASIMNDIANNKLGWPDIEWYWNRDEDMDPLIQAQVDDIYIKNKTVAPSEVRENLNMDPLTDDQKAEIEAFSAMDKPPQNNGDGPNDTKPGSKDKPASRENDRRKVVKTGKKKLQIAALPSDKKSTDAYTAIQNRISRFLSKVGKKYAKQLSKTYSEVTKTIEDDDIDKVLADLDLGEFDELIGLIEPKLEIIAEASSKALFGELSITDSNLLLTVSERAKDFARVRAAELVGKAYNTRGEIVDNPNAEWAITDATRDMLRRSIASAFEDGLSPSQLSDLLEGSYAFSESRAETISRTEVARSHIASVLEAAKSSEIVVSKRVILGSKHDIDDICDFCQAQGAIPLDESFEYGDVPFHPNCVCALVLEYDL